MSGQGGGFNNPLVGSGGTLVLDHIQSSNYVAGSLGWAIFRNGLAEFGQAIIRGLLQLGGDGTLGRPGISFGVTPVPAELVAYYAGLPDPGTLIAGTLTITYDGTAGADYRYEAIFADNLVPPNQQLWYVGGLRVSGVVGESNRWLINPGGAFGNPDIVFSPSTAFLVKALIQSQVNATNAQAYEVEVAGEAGIRLTVNGDGSFHWGNGTLAPDATAYRSGVGQLAADPINANNGGIAEVFTRVAVIPGGFLNGWSDYGHGRVPLQFRKVAAPANAVQLYGVIQPGTKVDSTQLFTLPAGYQPQQTIDLDVSPNALAVGTTPARLTINGVASGTGGQAFISGVNAAGFTNLVVNAIFQTDI